MAFKKNIVVGIAVNPELGLEVAQIDFASKTVLKYGFNSEVKYDKVRKTIDLDFFKDALGSLIAELQIPKGSEVVVTLPSAIFRVADYTASIPREELSIAIEEELSSNPLFHDSVAGVSEVILPNSTIQFNKVAYTAIQKDILIEIAMQVAELGLKLVAIDTSVTSTLNALIYNDRIDESSDINWVMLSVENNCCRLFLMQGGVFVDSFEEKLSIGEVLGDEENYATVLAAVNPILAKLPSQRLFVISKTNLISAEILSSKLSYNAQIIFEEANFYAKAPFIEVGPDVSEDIAKNISVDVVGAAIYRDFQKYSAAPLNLFNATLGDVYLSTQPPVLKLGSFNLVMSMEKMISLAIVFAIIISAITLPVYFMYTNWIKQDKDELEIVNRNIQKAVDFIKKNDQVSAEEFNEADEVRIGLEYNKKIYSFYTIVGTEIPKKVWLTGLSLGEHVIIDGQADNLESIYSFFRNIKDYNPDSKVKLQKLVLASNSKLSNLSDDGSFDTDSIITSMNADFYEFRIADKAEEPKAKKSSKKSSVPDLENLE